MGEVALRETVTESYAAMAASSILSQFVSLHGMAVEDKRLALKWLTQRLIGLPKSTVKQMADMTTGLAAKNKFYSLAIVNDWLEQFGPQQSFKPLPPCEPIEPLDPAEIERRNAMVLQLKKQFAETTEAMRQAGKIIGKPLPVQQVDDPEARMRALANLDAMRGVNGVTDSETV